MRRAPLALVALLAVTLSACSAVQPGPDPEPSESSGPAYTEVAEVAWRAETPMLGGVTVADGVAVGYVSPKEGQLFLRGWSVETGEELWSRDASPGAVTQGVALWPTLMRGDDGRALIANVTAREHLQGVEVLAVADGSPVPHAGDDALLAVYSRPSTCPGSEEALPSALCFIADPAGDGGEAQYRIEGGTIAPSGGPLPDLGREVGEELYSSSGRDASDPEILTYAPGGEPAWSIAYEDLFGEGYSTDWGWSWRHDTETGTTLGWASPEDAEGMAPDRTLITSVGIDTASGEVLWQRRGFVLFCAPAGDALDVGCREEASIGTIEDDRYVYTDVAYALERIDVRTGEPLWELQVADGGPPASDEILEVGDDTRVVTLVDGVPSVVDLTTGEAESVEHWSSTLCHDWTSYTYGQWGTPVGEPVRWTGGEIATSCAEGEPVGRTPALLIELVGTEASDGRWLLPTDLGLVAFDLPARDGA